MLDFVIVNDIRQPLSNQLPNGPWIHHATVKRREREYIIFRHGLTSRIYLERVVLNTVNVVLERIDDDNEWTDLYNFALAAGLLNTISSDMKIYDKENKS